MPRAANPAKAAAQQRRDANPKRGAGASTKRTKLVGDSNTMKGVEKRIGGPAIYGKRDSLGRVRNVSFDQFITAAGGKGATGKLGFANDTRHGTRHGGVTITSADGSKRFIRLGDAQRKYFYRQVKEGKSKKGKISKG